MNNLIKHIVEAFDFNSINKQKKTVNAYDMVLFPIINKIKHYESLTKDEYNILTSYTGIYKVTSKNDLITLKKSLNSIKRFSFLLFINSFLLKNGKITAIGILIIKITMLL